jgi:hypothetical protein
VTPPKPLLTSSPRRGSFGGLCLLSPVIVAAVWVATIHSGGSQSLANANIDADARDPYLVSRFKLVSAQAFAIYRMDPHVVVFRPAALGCRFVGPPSQGAGVDLYSRASGIQRVVLDTPGNGDPCVG